MYEVSSKSGSNSGSIGWTCGFLGLSSLIGLGRFDFDLNLSRFGFGPSDGLVSGFPEGGLFLCAGELWLLDLFDCSGIHSGSAFAASHSFTNRSSMMCSIFGRGAIDIES